MISDVDILVMIAEEHCHPQT